MHPMIRKAITLLLALTLCACTKSAPPPTTAPATAPTTASASPRIISLVPAATFNLVLIHAADCLVGVTKYDQIYLPEAQQNLPIVGDYETLNYEKLVSLHPTDVLVQMDDPMIPQRLRTLAAEDHFTITNLHLDTLDDLWKTVATLGKISGHDIDASRAVMTAQAELQEIADALHDQPKPKVLYILGTSPLSIAGSKTFMDQMVTLAGGDNLGAKIGTFFPTISNETLIHLAPDVLLISAPDQPDQQPTDPRLDSWQRFQIPAVWNDRVWLVTDGNSLMASVDIAKQVRALSKLIHKGASATSKPPAATEAAP
jgi:iron complex transport system substrate-binding protein